MAHRRILLSAPAGLALPSALIVAAAQAGSRTLSLAHALPSLIRQKDVVAVKGTITGVPRRTRVVLQLKRIDGRWTVPASTRATHHGAFTIDWRVPASEDPGPVELRVAGLSRTHKLLVATKAVQVAASETVPGGHSYTLAPLPAGSYTLKAGACRGTATVTAGEQTTANADCDYP